MIKNLFSEKPRLNAAEVRRSKPCCDGITRKEADGSPETKGLTKTMFSGTEIEVLWPRVLFKLSVPFG